MENRLSHRLKLSIVVALAFIGAIAFGMVAEAKADTFEFGFAVSVGIMCGCGIYAIAMSYLP